MKRSNSEKNEKNETKRIKINEKEHPKEINNIKNSQDLNLNVNLKDKNSKSIKNTNLENNYENLNKDYFSQLNLDFEINEDLIVEEQSKPITYDKSSNFKLDFLEGINKSDSILDCEIRGQFIYLVDDYSFKSKRNNKNYSIFKILIEENEKRIECVFWNEDVKKFKILKPKFFETLIFKHVDIIPLNMDYKSKSMGNLDFEIKFLSESTISKELIDFKNLKFTKFDEISDLNLNQVANFNGVVIKVEMLDLNNNKKLKKVILGQKKSSIELNFWEEKIDLCKLEPTQKVIITGVKIKKFYQYVLNYEEYSNYIILA